MVGGTAVGSPEHPVSGPVAPESSDSAGIAFAEDSAFLSVVEASGVGSVLVKPGLVPSKPHIVVDRPREAFLKLLYLVDAPLPLAPDIHPTAVVDPGATVAEGVRIGPYAVVESGARLGAGVRVYAHAYVGEDCEVGENSQILPHAVLVRNVILGARCVVQPGAVVGADGFGFAWDGKRHVKIPQIGRVEIGPDCEIGALSAVDRATLGVTEIGEGTKLDNFVQVAHNVKIGEHTVIASQTGIGGSSTIGSRVSMAGQCAVGDHRKVGDDIRMGGRTGVAQDIFEPGDYWGTPAIPIRDAQRIALLKLKLPEILSRLKALEKARQ
jgi:UDP-3-O-[3-hydroxymyristoyl] glucosamine N-acyltransferase